MSLVWAGLLLLGYCVFVWTGFARARDVFRAGKTGEIRTSVFGGRTIYRAQEPGPFRQQVLKGMAYSVLMVVPLVLLGNLVLRAVLGAIASL